MLVRAAAILITITVLIVGVIFVIRALIPVTITTSDAGARWVQETLPYPTATATPIRPVTPIPPQIVVPPYYPGTTVQPPVAQVPVPAAPPQAYPPPAAVAPPQQALPPTAQIPAPAAPASSSAECKLQQEPFRGFIGGPTVTQHIDFYVDGMRSVSYIVGPTATRRWNGAGSIWQAPANPCDGAFDWIADASNYARGRLNQGHSGVIVDTRTGQVLNVGTLAPNEVSNLIGRLRAAQN